MDSTISTDHESEEPFHPALTRKLIQSALAAAAAATTIDTTTTTTLVAVDGEGPKSNNNNNNNHGGRRLTNEAVVAASEVLRLFVQEARHRAGILAECEHEGRHDNDDDDDDDNDGGDEKNRGAAALSDSVKGPVVGAHHIARIAAELLMDFS